jgi:hypothetical protein
LTVNAQQARSNHVLASGFSPQGTGRTPVSSRVLRVNTAIILANIGLLDINDFIAAGHGVKLLI